MLASQKHVDDFLELWIDTPYMFRQRVPKRGTDCLNLVIAFLNHIGKDVDSKVAYGETPMPGLLYDILKHDLGLKKLRNIPQNDRLYVGDIIAVYRIGGIPYHVGIYIGNNIMLECGNRYVQTRHLGKYFEKRIASVWRVEL